MNSSKPMRPAPPPGGASQSAAPAKPGSPYSRFIPREELNSFAAWKPGALSGADEVPQAPIQRAEPPAPPAPPKPSPAEELAAQIKTARTSGYQDGYRDGLVALEGFKQTFAAQITAQLGVIAQSYSRQLDDLQQDMARALAVSATHLARQIVRSELAQRPELVAAVAQEAVETLLLSAQHITLRVHPDDHALVAQGAAEVLDARGARLMSDSSITRGGCVVESSIGVIDGSVEARWRRAAASLGCAEAWNGSAPKDEDDEVADE